MEPKYKIGDEVYYLNITSHDINSLEIGKSKISGIRIVSKFRIKYSLESTFREFYEKEITLDLIKFTESTINTMLTKFGIAYKNNNMKKN